MWNNQVMGERIVRGKEVEDSVLNQQELLNYGEVMMYTPIELAYVRCRSQI